jgi:hypothetical protein
MSVDTAVRDNFWDSEHMGNDGVWNAGRLGGRESLKSYERCRYPWKLEFGWAQTRTVEMFYENLRAINASAHRTIWLLRLIENKRESLLRNLYTSSS